MITSERACYLAGDEGFFEVVFREILDEERKIRSPLELIEKDWFFEL